MIEHALAKTIDLYLFFTNKYFVFRNCIFSIKMILAKCVINMLLVPVYDLIWGNVWNQRPLRERSWRNIKTFNISEKPQMRMQGLRRIKFKILNISEYNQVEFQLHLNEFSAAYFIGQCKMGPDVVWAVKSIHVLNIWSIEMWFITAVTFNS